MPAQEDLVTSIDVKEAVQRAKEFAAKIFEPEKITRLGLEAVERSEDRKYWLVTLGFSRQWSYPAARKSSPLDDVLPRPESEPRREYKVFRVDASSGAVTSIARAED